MQTQQPRRALDPAYPSLADMEPLIEQLVSQALPEATGRVSEADDVDMDEDPSRTPRWRRSAPDGGGAWQWQWQWCDCVLRL